MDTRELLEFVSMENKRLRELYYNYSDQEKRILAHTVKLSEELGELCDEVLCFNKNQRKAKIKDGDRFENLAEEFADVLIATLILADEMNVEVEVGLRKKIAKINKRYENE